MKKFLIISFIINVILLIIIYYKIDAFKIIKSKLVRKTFQEIAVEERSVNSYYYKNSTFYAAKESIFEILPVDSGSIIFLGDSYIEWCNWDEFFKDKKIINRGIGGDNTEGVLKRLDVIVNSHPEKIFLKIGFNDLFFSFTVNEIITNYKSILNYIQTKSPTTKIYLINYPPTLNFKKVPNSKINDLNAELLKTAQEYNLPYIDIHKLMVDSKGDLLQKYTFDGVHLNGQGYLVWKSLITKYIYE